MRKRIIHNDENLTLDDIIFPPPTDRQYFQINLTAKEILDFNRTEKKYFEWQRRLNVEVEKQRR